MKYSLLLLVACSAYAQTAPAPYQALWNQLATQDCTTATCTWPNPPGNTFVGAGDLPDFSAYVASLGSGSGQPILVGQLTAANANNGPGLLNAASMLLYQRQIAGWKAVGAGAISVEVSFPMLYQPFLDGAQPGYYSKFYSFYQNIAALIRAQGLKVMVESQALMAGGATGSIQSNNWPTLAAFYSGFSGVADYAAARAAAVASVAAAMRPDYFVLQEEPDTESTQSGMPALGTVSGSTQMLNATIPAARAANIPGMKIGAGFGTWLQAYQSFANSFTHQSCGTCLAAGNNLDFLDLHIFPIDENVTYCTPTQTPCTYPIFWWNTMWVVNRASSGTCSNGTGCQLSVSQTWLRKVANGEWLQNVPGPSCPGGMCGIGDMEEAREAFSFWSPLDVSFMQTLHNLACASGFVFIAPFNTQNLFAAVTWSSGSGNNLYPDGDGICTPPCGHYQAPTLFSSEQSNANGNMAVASYTATATGMHDIWTGGQSVAPTVPAQVSAIRTSSAVAAVSWTPATDSIGVAGYQVSRNGTPVGTVMLPPFSDTGLAAATNYTYRVRAFNLGTGGALTYSAWSAAVTSQQPGAFLSGHARISGKLRIQ